MPMLGRREQEQTAQSFTPPERLGQGRTLGRKEQYSSAVGVNFGAGAAPPERLGQGRKLGQKEQTSQAAGLNFGGSPSPQTAQPESRLDRRVSQDGSRVSAGGKNSKQPSGAGSRLPSEAGSQARSGSGAGSQAPSGAGSLAKTPKKESNNKASAESPAKEKQLQRATARVLSSKGSDASFNPWQTEAQGHFEHPAERAAKYPEYKPITSRRSEASTEYSFEHMEGYCGHVPDEDRNLRKYGKTFGKDYKPQPPPSVASTSASSRFRTSYGASMKDPGPKARGNVPSEASSRPSSSHYSFEHLEGYAGHQPDHDRNAGKYGKSFNNPETILTSSARVGGLVGKG